MLRRQVTFEVRIQDEAQVVSGLRTATESTGTDHLSDLMDVLHAEVRDGASQGTVYLTSSDFGALYWTTDLEEAIRDDDPMSVHWEWVDTTVGLVEVV